MSEWNNEYETTTWDAKLKFGPGERFLLGTGGALFAPLPEFDPLRFLRLLGGLCASVKQNKDVNEWNIQKNFVHFHMEKSILCEVNFFFLFLIVFSSKIYLQ